MGNILRIGIMGLSHDHVWDFLAHASANPTVQIIAAGDADSQLRDKAEQAGIPKTYTDPYKMLEKNELDAVAIFGDNRSSVDYGIAAAHKGLHMLLEKPMAADYAGAVALYAAAKKAGVTLMVNWPFAWWPNLQHALSMIRRGKIGNISIYRTSLSLNCSRRNRTWINNLRQCTNYTNSNNKSTC